MGWASGSSLLNTIAEIVMPHIPKDKRDEVADRLVHEFEMEDCDTICECDQKDIDAAYRRKYPGDDDLPDDEE